MAETIALTEAVYYILLSLLSPMHGYGIMLNVTELSKGRVVLAAGTLYGALNALLDRKWIELIDDPSSARKKEYKLTPNGLSVLAGEIQRLRELVDNGERIMGDHEEKSH